MSQKSSIIVKIEIRKGKSGEYKKALLSGVHQALVQAIKIPDHDRKQRFYELDADNFEAELIYNRTYEHTYIC